MVAYREVSTNTGTRCVKITKPESQSQRAKEPEYYLQLAVSANAVALSGEQCPGQSGDLVEAVLSKTRQPPTSSMVLYLEALTQVQRTHAK